MNDRFTPQWLRKQKNHLLKVRDHLTGNANYFESIGSADREVGDEVDLAADVYDRLVALTNRGRAGDTLHCIDDALRRIGEGGYGVCQATGQEITPERLEAIPWAQYTLQVQEEVDKGLKHKYNWNKEEEIPHEKEDDDEEEADDEIKTKGEAEG